MILIPDEKPKPTPAVEMIVKVPDRVSVVTSTSSREPVKVTVKPAGMTMEHLPVGTAPEDHVSTASNAPDCLAVNVTTEPPAAVVVALLGTVVVARVGSGVPGATQDENILVSHRNGSGTDTYSMC